MYKNIAKNEYPQLIVEMRNFIDSKIVKSKTINGTIVNCDRNNKTITADLEEDLNLSEGSMVSVNRLIGIVQESHLGSKVKIELTEDISSLKSNSIVIDTNITNINLKRIEKALEKIENDDLNDYNLKILNCILGNMNPSYQKRLYKIPENLNPSQRDAVTLSLNADDFHLILGPPGTGKTHVIKEIIEKILQGNETVLVTAHTNRAVDNILEQFEGIEKDKILRIGTKISSPNKKYSLKERRQAHPDWIEVVHLEDMMKKTSKDVENSIRKIEKAKKEINETTYRKNKHSYALNDIKSTIKEYEKKKEGHIQKTLEKKVNNDSAIKRKEKLEKNCEEYYSLAKFILKVENIEDSLPDAEEFYQLEAEIKKMEGEKLKKRLISIFNKKNYNEFLRDLEDKQAYYNLLVKNYEAYWDLKDALEKHYKEEYPDSDGRADEDALYYEKELLKNLDEYLGAKKVEIELKMENEKISLLDDSYSAYINSLNKKMELMEVELKYINTVISLQLNSKKKLESERDNVQKTLEKYEEDKKNLLNYIDNEIISKSQLIATTVLSSANYLLNDEIFDFMVMDEASQVSGYSSILPLLKCKKFILVGDNKQLQPIKESKLSKKLNKSIFNHFIDKYPLNYSFLDTQYRMNQEICDAASSLFYEGKIKTYPPIAKQTLESLKDNLSLNSDNPLTFVDTADVEYYEDGLGGGCENCKEARLVVKVVNQLIENDVDPQEIGVITPYKKHKNLIKRHLKIDEIEVDTVYSFQGKEKDVIVMSFCKSSIGRLKEFSKSFIADPNQLNVSVTRARKKLIIIGNSKTIGQSRLISQLLETMGEINTINLPGIET